MNILQKSIVSGCFLLISFSQAFSQIDSILHKELVKMFLADQKARVGFSKAISSGDMASLNAMTRSDSMHTLRLRKIVDSLGWPTKEMVGTDGLQAAFVLVQHIRDYQWQDSLLPIIKKQAINGDIPKEAYAMLQDRVLMREGKPQIYGINS